MARNIERLDQKFLESQIGPIGPAFGHYDVDGRLYRGMKRIKPIMETYRIDALEALAKSLS